MNKYQLPTRWKKKIRLAMGAEKAFLGGTGQEVVRWSLTDKIFGKSDHDLRQRRFLTFFIRCTTLGQTLQARSPSIFMPTFTRAQAAGPILTVQSTPSHISAS